MKILDHFPIVTAEEAVALPDGRYYTVKPGQIVLTVCLRVDGRLTPAFPAFLDSGHNHNFSISDEQLRTWLNVDPSTLARIGTLRINQEETTLRKADVLLYRNRRGLREITGRFHEFLFSDDRGIAVHTRPIRHLPILGIRGIFRQRLMLRFDGKSLTTSLTT